MDRREFIKNAFRIKQDCFAYCDRGCKALTELYCAYEDCKFYKTEKERCDGCKKSGAKITCTECVKKGLK